MTVHLYIYIYNTFFVFKKNVKYADFLYKQTSVQKSMQIFFAKIVQSELATFLSDNHNPHRLISISTISTFNLRL